MSEWQPIETAPKDGTDIIVADFDDDDYDPAWDCGVARFKDGEWFGDAFSPSWRWKQRFAPTHWLPLPAPSKKALKK